MAQGVNPKWMLRGDIRQGIYDHRRLCSAEISAKSMRTEVLLPPIRVADSTPMEFDPTPRPVRTINYETIPPSKPKPQIQYTLIMPRTVESGMEHRGKISAAQPIGTGWRVIVNARSELLPFFRISPGSVFGKARHLRAEFSKAELQMKEPVVPVSTRDKLVDIRKRSQIKEIQQRVQLPYYGGDKNPATYFKNAYTHLGLHEWLTYPELCALQGPRATGDNTERRCIKQKGSLGFFFSRTSHARHTP